MGWDAVFESVFSAASLLPKTVYTLPVPKPRAIKEAKSKAAEEDEEYTAPDEDEVVGDAADLEPED